MDKYLSLKRAVVATGLHPNTLRKFADNGTIGHYRLPNGDRRFDVSKLVCVKEGVVCYARVSTPKQKTDLERQANWLSEKYLGAEIIKDIGSGINFKRKGLRSILERSMRGERLTIVVSYRDRLARFGFDLIQWIIERNGGQVVVLNQLDTSPQAELVADLMAIVTVFSSRLHGLRSYKHALKVNIVETDKSAEAKTTQLGGHISLGVQLDDKPS